MTDVQEEDGGPVDGAAADTVADAGDAHRATVPAPTDPADGSPGGASAVPPGRPVRIDDVAGYPSVGPGNGLDDAAPAGLRERVLAPAPLLGTGVLVTALLAFAAAAGLYAAFTGSGPALADSALLSELIEVRSGGLTQLAVFVTNIGNTTSMAVLAVAVAGWCWYRGRRADAVLAIVAMAGSAALFNTLKNVFDRARPPVADRLVHVGNESLPSGHATMSIVVIGTIVVLAWAGRSAMTRAVLVVAAVAWVGAVGATRVYLGVHWFSDVVAGWLVGAAWLALCVAVWNCVQSRSARTNGTPVR
jgi:membrane-associated phospholipid phosphatase